MGLRRYRRRVRLERCRRRIRDETGSIADIAAECAFDDPTTFSHAFEELFGVPPGESAVSRLAPVVAPTRTNARVKFVPSVTIDRPLPVPKSEHD
jgi:AraC-like DNA-binding protein